MLTLAIDNTGPSLTSYTLNATYKDISTNTYYVFITSQVPNLIVSLADSFGIKDAAVFFSSNGGTYSSIQMTNMSINGITHTTMIFNATLLN